MKKDELNIQFINSQTSDFIQIIEQKIEEPQVQSIIRTISGNYVPISELNNIGKRFEFKEVENKLDLNDSKIAILDTENENIISYDNACKIVNEQDEKIKQLKQSQNSKAIEELQKVKDYLLKEANNSDEISFVEYVIDDYIDNQITELRGEEDE